MEFMMMMKSGALYVDAEKQCSVKMKDNCFIDVVSAIDGTSHEIQIPSNEPQQKNILSANQFFSLIDMKESL
jgi:hypothetical protein